MLPKRPKIKVLATHHPKQIDPALSAENLTHLTKFQTTKGRGKGGAFWKGAWHASAGDVELA